MGRVAAAFLSILITAAISHADDTNLRTERAMAAMDDRDYAAAIVELRQIEASGDERFVREHHDYLLARLLDFSGSRPAAIPYYAAVSERPGPVRSYALMHLARIMRDVGNLFLERIYLEQLLALDNASFASVARLNLAENAAQTGNYRRAARLMSYESSTAEGKFIRDDTVLLADAYRRSGDAGKAREILINLLAGTPKPDSPDDAALAAVKALDAMDALESLDENEHFRRAKIYQFNREFALSRIHYEAIVARFSASPNVPFAMQEIARGFAQLSEHVEALKWHERIQERYPDTVAAKEALLLGAAAYGRVGKYKEAITRYQRFIDRFPQDERLDRAYLNLIDLLRDHSDDTEAMKWAAKTRERFPGTLPETLALFSEARMFFSRGEWEKGLAKLDSIEGRSDLGGNSVPGGTTLAEVQFLRGFAFEKTNNFGEAVDQYLAIPDGRGEYYGGRATERLLALAKNSDAQESILRRLAASTGAFKSKNPDERRRAALAAIRLTEAPEIQSLAYAILSQSFPLNSIPNANHRENVFNSLRLDLVDSQRTSQEFAGIESSWRRVPADFPIRLAPRELRKLYPAPFADLTVKYSERSGVDARLILAIMRQESRFAHDAKSVSAARGLMQFISSAATKAASDLGLEHFRNSDLYQPATSLLFGSHYIAQLGVQLQQQDEAVVASYNGGPENVKRWVARSRASEPDRFVAEIQFSQTKDYVQKVMASYRVYRELYDEKLRPRMTN